jgi:hypothetical protein
MNDEQLDDALQDLRAELSLEASPEFAAKVRQKIDERPARGFFGAWMWMSLAATCGVVVIAGALWLRPNGSVVTPTRFQTAAQTTKPAPVPSLAQGTTTTPTPTAATTNTNVNNRGGVATRATRPAAVVAAAARPELEVLVPTDQLDAIRRLMSSVRTGAVKDMPASASAIDPDTGELMKPKPIEIPLITIEPLPGTVEGRSGGSERK